MYLKRQKIPKNWPISRKGTTYVVGAKSPKHNGIPLLIILRDILKIVQNRKEAKKVMHAKQILLNGKSVYDEKNSALLFDVITISPLKKSYRIELSERGKFQIKEISNSETGNKISKVIDKKVLKGKKVQLNLSDGKNYISNLKCNVNDSVLIGFKERNVTKCLPLKEKSEIIIFEGKHAGKKGIVKKIIPENKIVETDIDGNDVNVLIKQLMVIK